MKHLTEADYAVSTWSGGRTTQLAIGPEGAVYAEREFLWRVSSATVELESSDFTALPDYDRLIAPLKGEMVLTHNGGTPVALKPLQVHAFSGGDATHSAGRCTDFNLMLRKGRCKGTMSPYTLGKGETLTVAPEWDTMLIYAVFGACRVLCGEEETLLREHGSCLAGREDGALRILAEENTVLMSAGVSIL